MLTAPIFVRKPEALLLRMPWAMELMPEFPGEFPPYLPEEWLEPVR